VRVVEALTAIVRSSELLVELEAAVELGTDDDDRDLLVTRPVISRRLINPYGSLHVQMTTFKSAPLLKFLKEQNIKTVSRLFTLEREEGNMG